MSISRQEMVVYTRGASCLLAGQHGQGAEDHAHRQWTPEFLSKNHPLEPLQQCADAWAIFYDGHYAIHGTDQIKRLGRPASKGCVRLHPDHAKVLFRMGRRGDGEHAGDGVPLNAMIPQEFRFKQGLE